ncbi:MAG TPA: DNA translocase FtsK [Anaerolineae bacterium]|nr:DNA translocase FtsK [Anaerolineae bacterium]HOQ97996.1 DNA translocase FtsK [Anaerolineae bacterium]HPL26687.1 DNA translocase FtsK [Anaerolineae bacterium]
MSKAKSRKRSSKARAGGSSIRLSPAAKKQIAGLALFMAALLTLLSLLSISHSDVTDAWLKRLGQAFGSGRLVIPFAMGAAGVLVFLAGIERPVTLRWRRVAGLGLLFGAMEGLLHALAFTAEPWALAAAGGGGGYLGGVIQRALVAAVGEVAALFLLLLLGGGALLLIIDRRPAEMVAAGAALWRRLASWRPQHHQPVGNGLPPLQPERPAGAPLGRLGATPVAASVGAVREPPSPLPKPTGAVYEPPLQRPRVIGESPQWQLPPVASMLDAVEERELSQGEIRAKVRTIEETLGNFGVPARVVEVNQGPTVTQFGLEPGFVERRDADGKMRRFKIKVNKIQALANDLALALAATSIRIEAPVPGRPMVGIEIPNEHKSPVTLRSVMESDEFGRLDSRLRIALGLDVSGQAVAADLATMPHLLIAGATGSGKSVCINAVIACLLCGNTPDELRLIMVDPKRVELTAYNGIPHLLTPVVVDVERVVGTLKWVTREMDRRYEVFAKVGVRNIEGYNASAPGRGDRPFPYLVVLIDELADLMMMAPDEVERAICRIAQLARATGIHLVIATQRPSVDVVTGLIKANFPARIAFAVSTQVDSRVILDGPGAEQLLGRGDMLFMAPDASKLVRLQGCFVSDAEIDRLAGYWRSLGASQAGEEGANQAPLPAPGAPLVQRPLWDEIAAAEAEDDGDALLDEAIALVRAQNRASVSLLQRKLRVGYARAARIMDLLEERGVVGPPEGPTHSREVLPEEDEEVQLETGEEGREA